MLSLTLFRDICRCWARRSVQWLHRLFSALSLRLVFGAHYFAQAGDKGRYESKQPLDPKTHNDVKRQDGHCNAPERPLALMTCSTTPGGPPSNPGPCQASGAHSPVLKPSNSPTSCLPVEDGNTAPRSHVPPGLTVAEPANILTVQNKPFKSFRPSKTSRYDRNIIVGNDLGSWIFKPLETLTVYEKLEVTGWEHFVQPEGQPYFLTSRRFRYLTEENLNNDQTLTEAERFINAFECRLQGYKIPHSNVEVVFELRRNHWSYYMVDLDHRRLFWIDDCVVDPPANFGVEHREQIRNLFDFEYWKHIEYFPNHRLVQNGLLDELLGILIQQHIDVETSQTSTSKYDSKELKSLMSSVKKLKTLQTSEHAIPYVVQVSARLMAVYSNERFLDLFGFNGVRLSPFQTVRHQSAKKERSLLMLLLSPILFDAPEVYLSALDRVWVDDVITIRHWREFQRKVEKDWEQFILYATVLVNANVAFLAIPSVISDDLGPGLVTSPASVVSQISIILSLGCTIIGLLLIRQTRIADDSSEDLLLFIHARSHPRSGIETLAILYSLPYALLLWGMATFLGSIAVASFCDMGGDITTTKRIIYGAVWAFVLAFIAWTIQTGWEKKKRRSGALPPTRAPACDSGTGSIGNTSPDSHRNATEEIELEEMDSNARSVRSHRSARPVGSQLIAISTVISGFGRLWQSCRGHNRPEGAEESRRNGFLSSSWPWRRAGPTGTDHGTV